jgi:hypothetical protein
MSDTPKSFLELDDAPVKIQPNANVFTPVSSLQPREGATAKQDSNGTWFNAIGLQSSEAHRHVAKQWQAQCSPLAELMDSVNQIASTKRDIVLPETDVRLKDSTHLTDGTVLGKKGMESLRLFTDVPSSMISYLEEYGYQDQLTTFVNDDLDRRHSDWTSNGKEPRNFRVRLRENEAGDEYVRAIVSERYGVIDNQDALEMIVNALPSDISDVLASHINHDGDDMFGNALIPDYMKSSPDSDYGVGISFRNSEVRNSTFKVSPFLFRAICLNGMIWGRSNSEISVNQKHMGKIDRKQLQEVVRLAIITALEEGNNMLTLLDYSKQVKVNNPLAVIAELSRTRKVNFTIEQGKAWHKGYIDSLQEAKGDLHDKSAFGIVNGLTRSAQNYSGSTREHMETVASEILAPSIDADLQAISKKWGRINANADSLPSNTVQQYAYVAV